MAGVSRKVKPGKELRQTERVNKSDFRRKIGRGSGKVVGKGPEMQVCLAHQKAMVTEAEETR